MKATDQDAPIVVQEIIYNKQDIPKSGEVFKFRDQVHKVIRSYVSLKLKKMYWVNIVLDGHGFRNLIPN
jgi:hypothetical protein